VDIHSTLDSVKNTFVFYMSVLQVCILMDKDVPSCRSARFAESYAV